MRTREEMAMRYIYMALAEDAKRCGRKLRLFDDPAMQAFLRLAASGEPIVMRSPSGVTATLEAFSVPEFEGAE